MYHRLHRQGRLAAAAIEQTAVERRAAAERHMATPGTAYDKIATWLLRERQIQRGCRLGQEPEIVATPELRQPLGDMLAATRARPRRADPPRGC